MRVYSKGQCVVRMMTENPKTEMLVRTYSFGRLGYRDATRYLATVYITGQRYPQPAPQSDPRGCIFPPP